MQITWKASHRLIIYKYHIIVHNTYTKKLCIEVKFFSYLSIVMKQKAFLNFMGLQFRIMLCLLIFVFLLQILLFFLWCSFYQFVGFIPVDFDTSLLVFLVLNEVCLSYLLIDIRRSKPVLMFILGIIFQSLFVWW